MVSYWWDPLAAVGLWEFLNLPWRDFVGIES